MPSRYAVTSTTYLKVTITDEGWFDYPDRSVLAVHLQIANENPRWAQSITQHRWDVVDYPAEHGAELQVEGGRYGIPYGEVKAGAVVKGEGGLSGSVEAERSASL